MDIIRKETKKNQAKLFFIGEFWNQIIETLKKTIIPEREHHLFSVINSIEELEIVIKNPK
ncbi:hypothetical protein AAON49_13765 [Pseudotenacibaculum sp. MALMAid0570]|uniref:hypothetical protein n=1 Tax=Pseudotenacibaculum sp. MALMAid0570 TaxID=3143938 RepID=UPI0032DFDA61